MKLAMTMIILVGVQSQCLKNGVKCGTDYLLTEDLAGCGNCCNACIAIDDGYQEDDWYCKCTPEDIWCGSTSPLTRFDRCNDCCSRRGVRVENQGFYENYYCNY